MAFLNKYIGNIGHFLTDKDFIGNIGSLEGLWTATKIRWNDTPNFYIIDRKYFSFEACNHYYNKILALIFWAIFPDKEKNGFLAN